MKADAVSVRTSESRAANFDRLARAYRWMEWFSFGPWLQRCRCAFLHEMVDSRSALVLGDGDGRFTARLLEAAPDIQVTAVDNSPAMLAALVKRAGENRARIRTFVADARHWPSPEEQPYSTHFDLVTAHFFLDCLQTHEIHDLIARIRPFFAKQARFIVSDFTIPDGWKGRWIARPLIGFLYWAFRWLTGLGVSKLPNHGPALREAGFVLEQKQSFLGGILVSESWRYRT